MNKLMLIITLLAVGCVTAHEFSKGDCALVDEAAIDDGRTSDGTPVLITGFRPDDNRYDAFIRWEGKVKGNIPVVYEQNFTAVIPKFDHDFKKTECPPYYQCLSTCSDPQVMCIAVCKP